MAYYLYKKIRDKRRAEDVVPQESSDLDHNPPAPISETRTKHGSNIDAGVLSETEDEKTISPPHEVLQDANDTGVSKEEKRAMRVYRWQIIGGLFLPMTVWGLNKTMIAAALPFIASDFQLTSAAFVPAWGQFADIFGRYSTMQASMLIMIIGSALCAGAPLSSFPMLLAGRGIQGVGSAGIMVMTRIIMSDKVSLKQNAINNTIFALVSGVGFGVGPVLGGVLTSITWRWCFIITIPLAAVGLVVTHFLTRPILLGPQDLVGQHEGQKLSTSESFVKRLSTVDFGGQLLFIFGMGLFVLALTWAGAYYPWKSASVLVPLVLGSLLVLAFLLWEYLMLPGHALAVKFPYQQPMIDLKLLWSRNAGVLCYINFITGMAMYAVFYFVDLYFTIVDEYGSSKAGLNLLYYLPGLGAGSYLAMFICNVWPRKTWWPLSFGTVVEALGITLLALAIHSGNNAFVFAMLGITGLGTGVRQMPNTLHGVGYYRKQVATIISLMSLSTALGSTLASTIMLNIFNNKMSNAGISLVKGPSSASSFSSIDSLPQDVQVYVRQHAQQSIAVAYYAISAWCWLGVVAVAFLGNVNIRKDSERGDMNEDGQTHTDNLTKGAYIGTLFRRRHNKIEAA